jgi:opine dehydrogenase
MTFNTGWVEHKGGNFLFYAEGVTAGVANTIENVDRERLAIVQKLELKEETFSELFYLYGFSSDIYPSVY